MTAASRSGRTLADGEHGGGADDHADRAVPGHWRGAVGIFQRAIVPELPITQYTEVDAIRRAHQGRWDLLPAQLAGW